MTHRTAQRLPLLYLLAATLEPGGLATSAQANDTSAALTTGGLVFTKSANIEMRSEDLHISRKEIRVRYRFFNRDASNQTVTVAFPMPDIGFSDDNNIVVPDDESDNFLQFRTSTDGVPVQARIEQRAFVGTTEFTARLTNLGVPLQPRAKRVFEKLDALPKPVQQQLTNEKIVRVDEYDQGKGMESHIAPEWTVKTTYFWEQMFPAGRELNVEHVYKPSVGGTVQTFIGARNADAQQKTEYAKRFCVDKSTEAAVVALTRKAGKERGPPPEFRISYVLKTGANWAGPIGDYRLTVDKGEPQAVVSFCEAGKVMKTGPTTFEVRKRNFSPDRDLDILLVSNVFE